MFCGLCHVLLSLMSLCACMVLVSGCVGYVHVFGL